MFSDSLHDIDHPRWFKISRKLFSLSLFLLGFLISVMILGTPEIAIAQDHRKLQPMRKAKIKKTIS